MKVESSIKENYSSTTVKPITDTEEIIKAICEWNGISLDDFKNKVGGYTLAGKDINGENIYVKADTIINPIGVYLLLAYDGKNVVFEKGNDKFFGTLRVRSETTRYMLGETVIEIPFRIRAENEDTGERIVIFPKTSDIIQTRMRNLFVVSPGWAERQKLEKEIMAKLIELAQVRGGNEIISTQNIIEELQAQLKKSGVELELFDDLIYLIFPWRKVRDTAGRDGEYIAPPIKVEIDFANRTVKCKGYSSHGFGTPGSRGNPCWGNRDTDIRHHLQDCDIKGLINLIVSWGYGYNSSDTGMEHEGRHPLAKLRDYMWYASDNRTRDEVKTEIKEMIKHIKDVKHDLNIDEWLAGCETIKEFISGLEQNEETGE